ncbi:MAG TPA: MFS transporter [Candidatus Angelobacter sp.]|nr:MFS transporter [Candidatus Angelobacter sp.]
MAAVTQPTPPAPAPPVHPLRQRNFRRLWLGAAISLFGDQFYLVALPWVVLQQTGSAVAMGTILMTAAIPRAILMLLGGALTDRISPRKIMMITASARTLFVAIIGVLLWIHILQIWQLYVLAFSFGVADAFAMPAGSSYLPSLVEPEQLVAANSAFQTMAQFTLIAGPAPAGIVIKILGAAWAFILDAISFLFIIGALWKLPDPPMAKSSSARPPMWKSILDGFAYVQKDVPLRTLLLLTTVLNFCLTGPFAVGLPYLAKTRFGSATVLGLVLSSVAVGGLLGTLLAGVWKIHRRGILVLGVCAVLSTCLCFMGILNRLWETMALLGVVGAAAGLTNVHIVAWIQQRVEVAVRGRVMSVVILAAYGLAPVSLAVAGFLIAWNFEFMFLLAGAAMLLVTAFGTMQKTVREIQ